MKKVILDQYDDKQVKDLLQGDTPDGKVNTVPEVFEEFKKKPADMDLEEWIKYLAAQEAIDPEKLKQLIDEAMEEQTATHADVDEIFDDVPDEPEPALDEQSEALATNGTQEPAPEPENPEEPGMDAGSDTGTENGDDDV